MMSENAAFCLVLDFVGRDLSVFKVGDASFSVFRGFYFSYLSPRSPMIISLSRSISKEVNVAYLGAGILVGVAFFLFGVYRGLSCSGRVWRGVFLAVSG